MGPEAGQKGWARVPLTSRSLEISNPRHSLFGQIDQMDDFARILVEDLVNCSEPFRTGLTAFLTTYAVAARETAVPKSPIHADAVQGIKDAKEPYAGSRKWPHRSALGMAASAS